METTSSKDGCIWPFFGQDPLLSTLAPRLWEWCEQLLVIPPKCSDIDRRKTSSLSSSPVASLEWDWKDQLQFLNLVSFSKTCPYSFLNVNICIIYMYIYICCFHPSLSKSLLSTMSWPRSIRTTPCLDSMHMTHMAIHHCHGWHDPNSSTNIYSHLDRMHAQLMAEILHQLLGSLFEYLESSKFQTSQVVQDLLHRQYCTNTQRLTIPQYLIKWTYRSCSCGQMHTSIYTRDVCMYVCM